MRLVIEVIYFLGILYYVQVEAKHIYWMKLKYVRLRNLFEVAIQLVNVIIAALWMQYLVAPARLDFDVNAPGYVDLYHLTQLHSALFAWVGFQGLLYALKLFKFLGISKKMTALWLTLASSGPDLGAFSIGFIIVVAGFGLFGMYIFGPTTADFHSFGSSMSALLRMPLGDFNYQSLESASPALAGVYFALYVGLVFIM